MFLLDSIKSPISFSCIASLISFYCARSRLGVANILPDFLRRNIVTYGFGATCQKSSFSIYKSLLSSSSCETRYSSRESIGDNQQHMLCALGSRSPAHSLPQVQSRQVETVSRVLLRTRGAQLSVLRSNCDSQLATEQTTRALRLFAESRLQKISALILLTLSERGNCESCFLRRPPLGSLASRQGTPLSQLLGRLGELLGRRVLTLRRDRRSASNAHTKLTPNQSRAKEASVSAVFSFAARSGS